MSQDTTKNKPIDPEIVKPGAAHPDDVIHVPKGSSKARFIGTLLIVILVLTTFTVSSQVLDVLGGRDASTNEFMTWKTPGGAVRHVTAKSFVETKRALAVIMPLVYIGDERDPTDEQTAAFIAMDESAAEAGIAITDQELRDKITNDFQTSDNYLNYCAQYRVSQRELETILRRGMRFERYRDLLAQGLSIPDPKAIETAWKGRHQEFMYDYVELPVSTLVEEARTQAPKGDDLKAWFDALSEPEKAAYTLKPEVSAEVVGLSIDGVVVGDAILAKFPRPEGRDVEQEARDYYDSFPIQRFLKTNLTPGQLPITPWEEAKAKALIEAPVYYALMDWVASLLKREESGETVDLAVEAGALGLAYRKQAEKLTQDAWRESFKDSFVGRRTLEVVFDPERTPGTLWPAITVDDKSFAYGRNLEVQTGRVPEFAEIASRVESAWADKKAKELALAKLEKFRDAFGTRPDPADATAMPFKPEADEAKFAEVAKAEGYTVHRRDWRERLAPVPAAEETPGDAFIRMNPSLSTQRETTVTKAELNRDGTVAYVVRVGGVRDPDISKMKIKEFQDASSQQSMTELMMFIRMKVGSREFLEQRFGADLQSWHREASPAR